MCCKSCRFVRPDQARTGRAKRIGAQAALPFADAAPAQIKNQKSLPIGADSACASGACLRRAQIRTVMKRRMFLTQAGAGLAATAIVAPASAQAAPPVKWRLAS